MTIITSITSKSIILAKGITVWSNPQPQQQLLLATTTTTTTTLKPSTLLVMNRRFTSNLLRWGKTTTTTATTTTTTSRKVVCRGSVSHFDDGSRSWCCCGYVPTTTAIKRYKSSSTWIPPPNDEEDDNDDIDNTNGDDYDVDVGVGVTVDETTMNAAVTSSPSTTTTMMNKRSSSSSSSLSSSSSPAGTTISAAVLQVPSEKSHQRMWLPHSAVEPLYWSDAVRDSPNQMSSSTNTTGNKQNSTFNSLLEKIEEQEFDGGRMRDRQYGVLHEDPTVDMRLLTENYTVHSLASALRDREEMLQTASQLAAAKDYTTLAIYLRDCHPKIVLERRQQRRRLDLTKPLTATSLETIRKGLMR
jgi:hypothetical protein